MSMHLLFTHGQSLQSLALVTTLTLSLIQNPAAPHQTAAMRLTARAVSTSAWCE
jgi:Na+-transporting NADH:ubiquinone oxidoreductase subunit NqrB